MGFAEIKELGLLRAPIALTNTMSVADVQKALSQWVLKRHPEIDSLMPVVLDCDDSSLNDIHGFHVQSADVNKALADAKSDFEEGAVGAGTGMISYDFKSGIGSSSRVVPVSLTKSKYTLGVLVNSNIGTDTRSVFRFVGIPLGKVIKNLLPTEVPLSKKGAGSIVVVLATDAPFDSVQLERLAKRAFSGVLRTGTPGYNGSGDFLIAFSTSNRSSEGRVQARKRLPDSALNDFFEAAADATEEAVLNSLLAGVETSGRDGNHVYAIPTHRVKELLSGKTYYSE